MRLVALAASAFAATHAKQHWSHAYDPSLAEQKAMDKTEILPLVAYGMAKKAADGICLIWDNRKFIMKCGRKIWNGLKRVGGAIKNLINSRALRNAAYKA